ncbi:GNAT family N-acetyltransferase [Gardnerella sp. KA00735]|nr:GNAT family N-acetyltransferase [Gardnerella sp. KA00735]PNP90039.1 GNAT family N-acetyltransferase [Gardnerella sp. KA00735]
MDNIIIKEAVPEDALARIEYSKKIGAETDNLSFGAEGFPISVDGEAEYICSILKDEKSCSFFAWKNGEIVGDVSLSALPRRMNHRAELGLTVLKSEWNKGLGSQLLQKAIEFAKSNDIEIINLEVRSDNLRAIHVYEKFGFRKIGTSPAYFKIADSYIDFDIMYLDLR